MTRLLSLSILTLAALAALTAAPTLAAQQRDRDRDRDRDDEVVSRIDTTLAFGERGTVDLSLISGEIVVTGWDRREVRIAAVSEQGTLDLDASPSRITLDVRMRGRHDNSGDTRYELSVPVGTRVITQSTSGDLAVRGVKGEVEAHTVSGDVQVDDAGPADLESVSGDVRGRRLTGEMRANTVSGDLELEQIAGDVNVETVSGDIVLREAQAKAVRAESVSGGLTYVGTIDPGGRYEFHSHSGDVRLALPAQLGAELGLETFSGEIESEFPITLTPGRRSDHDRPRRFDFTLGGGGARITVQTFSGNITLDRGAGGAAQE